MRPTTSHSMSAGWLSKDNSLIFRSIHAFTCAGRAVAAGFEVRVWTRRDAGREGGLAAATIPDEFKRLIGGAAEAG